MKKSKNRDWIITIKKFFSKDKVYSFTGSFMDAYQDAKANSYGSREIEIIPKKDKNKLAQDLHK